MPLLAKSHGSLTLPTAFRAAISPAVKYQNLFCHVFIKAKTRPESERVSKCY
jgi:hypothetical protein